MSDVTASARAVLLRALDSLDEAAAELGEGAEVRHLAVVYSVVRVDDKGTIHHKDGWCQTHDPHWVIAKLLMRAAESFDHVPEAHGFYKDDEPDDDGDEGGG